MASEQGVMEHYSRACDCAWQQPFATPLTLDLPTYISYTLS
jgi:hypothetical protein